MNHWGAEFDRRDDYCGRGMYNKTTIGIVVGDLPTFIGAVARAAASLDLDDARLQTFLNDVDGVRWDNMGRSDIIVY
jgi:hypothetical protein